MNEEQIELINELKKSVEASEGSSISIAAHMDLKEIFTDDSRIPMYEDGPRKLTITIKY